VKLHDLFMDSDMITTRLDKCIILRCNLLSIWFSL